MATRTARTRPELRSPAPQLTATAGLPVTVGLDVGDRQSHLCVLDERGDIVEESRVPTTPAALERRFRAMAPARVVLETSTHSPWISRLLAACGHEVIVGNARRLRLIADSDTKSDRLDAEFLARVGRVDPVLLAPIQHRAEATQTALALLRARDALVQTRTQLVNHVRGAVKSAGGRLPKCSTHSFARQVDGAIPEALRAALAPVLALITRVSADIGAYDRQVEQLAAAQYPETRRLRQVAGVGPLTALCFVLTLEDPARFPCSRAVGSYLGLRPRQRDSGAAAPALRITKTGDPMLRRLLVTSAHYILGPFAPESDLRRWGLALAAHGGKSGKKRAVVAVARKLSVLLHRLWASGSTYVPTRAAA
jgi:transposase